MGQERDIVPTALVRVRRIVINDVPDFGVCVGIGIESGAIAHGNVVDAAIGLAVLSISGSVIMVRELRKQSKRGS